MTTAISDLGATVKDEFVAMFCGDLLGSGCGRQVYVHSHDPLQVIKIENVVGSFQNVIEWKTWEALKNTSYSIWLAPVRHISASGSVLIMDRTQPLIAKTQAPKQMPSWLTDFKLANYGILNGRVVAHDYGSNLLLNHGAFGGKLRKANWRNE